MVCFICGSSAQGDSAYRACWSWRILRSWWLFVYFLLCTIICINWFLLTIIIMLRNEFVMKISYVTVFWFMNMYWRLMKIIPGNKNNSFHMRIFDIWKTFQISFVKRKIFPLSSENIKYHVYNTFIYLSFNILWNQINLSLLFLLIMKIWNFAFNLIIM